VLTAWAVLGSLRTHDRRSSVDAPLDQAVPPGPGGTSQSYGQENRLGIRDPSTQNPGKVGQGVFTLHPGFACNGEHGFFAGGE
jgi:hypothetical protein